MKHFDIKTIIITGLAGSGKSTALNALEDSGFYAIDNLPIFLLSELVRQAENGVLRNNKLAIVMDCRDPSMLSSFESVRENLAPGSFEILFLDADEEVLVRRFSELRRQHPLSLDCTVRQAIMREKQVMAHIRQMATVVDTSHLSPHDLGRKLKKIYGDKKAEQLTVNLISFGFKHGPPPESESLWDVRFLPNPYFIPELKNDTGLEKDVAEYVLQNKTSRHFFELLEPLLFFLVHNYQQEGKAQLTISIGCTGGRHRSVAVTEKIKDILAGLNIRILVEHRDIKKS